MLPQFQKLARSAGDIKRFQRPGRAHNSRKMHTTCLSRMRLATAVFVRPAHRSFSVRAQSGDQSGKMVTGL